MVFRALKREVRDASGVDTERLSKNVSAQMMKASFQKELQNKQRKRGYSSKFKTAANTPIENILPSIKIDKNCFKTVGNLSILRVIRFNSTEI
jgi:hypothetical protein